MLLDKLPISSLESPEKFTLYSLHEFLLSSNQIFEPFQLFIFIDIQTLHSTHYTSIFKLFKSIQDSVNIYYLLRYKY